MSRKTSTVSLVVIVLVFTSFVLVPESAEAQTYSVSFTVTGLSAGVRTRYYVDSVLNGTIGTGETRTLDLLLGTAHTLSVDLDVSGDNGTRYRCVGNVWPFSGAEPLHVFNYKTQYYLEVATPYGSASGSDWYDEGTAAQAELAANMTAGSEGVRYVFVRWGQDASGQQTVSEPIVMNRAKKAIAEWKTQHSLQMLCDPSGVFPALTLWFDADSTAEFVAPEGTNGTDSRQVFVQWIGDYSGTTVHGSLRMDRPKSVTAKYKAQYRLSITYDPPNIAQRLTLSNTTWYDAGQTVALGPVPQLIPIIESPVQRYAWSSWNVDDMTEPGTSVEILMNKPHSVRLIYQTQYYLLVTSALGEPTGTGWYASGQSAKFGVTYAGPELLVKHTLAGWRLNSSNVITTLPPSATEVIMDRPYVIEAQWNVDYTPLWVFLVALLSGVVVFTAVVIIIVKRPRSLGRLRSSFRFGLGRRKISTASIPPQTSLVPCQKCGLGIPSTAEYCHSCGAVQVRAQRPATPDSESIDNQVYEYIVKQHGEISLSQASKDLGLSPEQVRLSTERLKKEGRLG
jgi:hypothetical protein